MELSTQKSALSWKTVLGGLSLVALMAAAHFLPVAAGFQHVDTWMKGSGQAAPLIFVGLYAAGTVLFVPGSVMTIAAGILFGFWAIPVVSAGATLGAALAFLVARYLARERVAKLIAANEKFRAVDKAVGERGGKLIGLLRLSPVIPFNLSNYFFGLTNVGFWPYVFASWLGMLPGCCLYVYLGAAGKAGLDGQHRPHSTAEYVFLGTGLVATVVVMIIITRVARRALANAEVPKA